MIKSSTQGNYIDLNKISTDTEISINHLMSRTGITLSAREAKENKFNFEEVEVNDASSSIYYSQHKNKVLISVYGTRETRYREKAKTEEAIVEIYTKFNYEINKESNNVKF